MNPSAVWTRTAASGTATVVLGLVVVWGFFQSLNDNFLSARNLSNLLLQIAVLGTLAVGMVIVLILGEIDLSIGAIAGVSAAVLAQLITGHGWPAWAAIASALLLGAAIGVLHGTIIAAVGIPSFIITLAGLLVWQGVQLWLVGDGGQIPIRDSAIRSIASSYLVPAFGWVLAVLVIAGFAGVRLLRRTRRVRNQLAVRTPAAEAATVAGVAVVVLAITWTLNSYFGIPWVFVLLLGLAAAGGVLMTGTNFGRHVYAIGGNREAARRAGIPVRRTVVLVFALISAIAALAGIIEASRQFSASNALGGGTLQLNAIAAAVIGGTSLFGGRGRVHQAVLGALVVGSVQNGLDLLGEPAAVKNIATGVILVVAVVLDALGRRRRAL
ncbi:ABC transporter permease subunit [Actinoplanes sp. TBRC 11911]|uniref:sugar ABC transporter permease n=1 Tax=Actinoplanes sp. TBRC 11911 TaxID=2729386 RepID=UPI002898BC9B|nr:sugar ABC transporter permease [Actinoplanes sp. TBRC 11911]